MYDYAEREWSLLGIAFTVAGCFFAFLYLYLEYGAYEFVETAPFIVPLVIGLGFLNVVLFRKIWIGVTKAEIKVSTGIFRKRTIQIADIESLERTKVGFFTASTHKGWFVKVERFAVSRGDAFRIDLKEGVKGKPCIIQSKNTDEIIKILRRINPAIEIR